MVHVAPSASHSNPDCLRVRSTITGLRRSLNLPLASTSLTHSLNQWPQANNLQRNRSKDRQSSILTLPALSILSTLITTILDCRRSDRRPPARSRPLRRRRSSCPRAKTKATTAAATSARQWAAAAAATCRSRSITTTRAMRADWTTGAAR